MISAFGKMKSLFNNTRAMLGDRRGATAIEYGLIAGLIAIVIIGGATSVGSSLTSNFSTVATKLGAEAPQ